MLKAPLLIFGAGGAAREIARFAEDAGSYEPCAFIEEDGSQKIGSRLAGRPVMDYAAAREAWPQAAFVIAIGSSAIRRRVAEAIPGQPAAWASIVHPRAYVGEGILLGEGTVVSPNAVLTTDVTVGRHCYINVSATLSHDCRLGDFVTVAPGAHVTGNVHLADEVFVGAGATFLNGTPDRPLRVGAGAVIGAGACVIEDVAAGATVVGVPARPTQRT